MDSCYSLELALAALTLLLMQPCTVTNATAARNRFNRGNLPNDLEVHATFLQTFLDALGNGAGVVDLMMCVAPGCCLKQFRPSTAGLGGEGRSIKAMQSDSVESGEYIKRGA